MVFDKTISVRESSCGSPRMRVMGALWRSLGFIIYGNKQMGVLSGGKMYLFDVLGFFGRKLKSYQMSNVGFPMVPKCEK